MKPWIPSVGLQALMVGVLASAGLVTADEPKAAPFPAPVKQYTAKDLPLNGLGENIWSNHNHRWGQGIGVFGKWVYVSSSQSGHIVVFERNPMTSELQYKAATPFERHTLENAGGSWLHVRTLADGGALLYLFYSTHTEQALFCYAIDPKSGGLKLTGRSDAKFKLPIDDVSGGYGYPTLVWSPDQSLVYLVGVKKIVWYRFGDNGLLIPEGKGMACTHPGKAGRGRGHALFANDGRHLYVTVEKMEPKDKVFWQVDAYECTTKTGELTFLSTVDLPELAQEPSNELMGFTPDGKLLYLVDERATVYYALKRDVDKGTLSILHSGKPDASMAGAGGPPWTRNGKFAFAADGKTGYYLGTRALGSFALDPSTGVLSGFRTIGGTWSKLELDAASGNLLVVGGTSIASFKTAAAAADKPAN